jgi:capsular polysaccharide biosynthesis protein
MMQLYHIFAILRRFWPPVIILPLLVIVISVGLALSRTPIYGSSAMVLITQAPQQNSTDGQFGDVNLNYSWQSSEFILDDLPQVVSSTSFATDVAAFMAGAEQPADIAAIRAGLRAEHFHRSVTLSASATSPEQATAMLEAAIQALQTYGLKYWDRSEAGADGLHVAVLNPPGGAAVINGWRTAALNVALRTGLAFAAGVGLALLLFYLDDTLRDRRQAEQWLGLPVVGTIPEE